MPEPQAATSGPMPTIALVDDDRNILTSVSIALEAEGYRVQTYTDGASALDGLKQNPPDLAIFDIKMPRMDGMELLRRLRQKSDLPVIFLTSKDEEIDELFGLKMGADDFIRKPFSQRLLVERVKAVLRRFSPKEAAAPKEGDAKVLERGLLKMDPERHTCTWKGEPVTLTVTEFLILQALAMRPGVVKSRNALMDAAYDDQVYVDDRTIDSHIKRLRKKFKAVDDDFEMIETLYGVGYRFKESLSGRDPARRRAAIRHAGRPRTIDDSGTGPGPLAAPAANARRTRAGTGADAGRQPALKPVRERLRRLARLVGQRASSSLVRRIVVLNLAGLVALLLGFLYLNQFREGLIDARVQSLLTQGEIIAGAVAASATVDTDIDHHRSRQAAAAPGRRERRPRRRQRARILHQSRARGAAAAPPGDADAHPRPHLRPRRLPAGRQPLALFARRHPALRPAAARRRTSRRIIERTWNPVKRRFGRTGRAARRGRSTPPTAATCPR